jgi:hypothetical protein
MPRLIVHGFTISLGVLLALSAISWTCNTQKSASLVGKWAGNAYLLCAGPKQYQVPSAGLVCEFSGDGKVVMTEAGSTEPSPAVEYHIAGDTLRINNGSWLVMQHSSDSLVIINWTTTVTAPAKDAKDCHIKLMMKRAKP